MLEYAIDRLPNIEFEEEENILKRRIDILKIFNLLDDIEAEIIDFSQLESNFYEIEVFITTHLEEMAELKKIINSNIISFNHIKWFFNSELFDLILDVVEEASFLPSIYKFMLGEKLITQQAEPNEHIELLLIKKSKEKQAFNYESFRQILYSKTNIPKPISKRFSISPDGTLLHHKRKKIPSPLITESTAPPERKKLRFN